MIFSFMDDSGPLSQVLNALPHVALIVDNDARILFRNPAAVEFLGNGSSLNSRVGEAAKCIHAQETPGGCGRSPSCRDCVLRNSVRASFGGQKPNRVRTTMQFRREGELTEVPVLVTATPFDLAGERFSLLFVEDISSLMELGQLIPICSGCKKIRTDDNYWDSVEHYIKSHVVNAGFSHGMCPDCIARLYPDYAGRLGTDGGRAGQIQGSIDPRNARNKEISTVENRGMGAANG